MPRRIPIQVTQTVSRLLEGGYVKKPPAWYEPTLRHPPAIIPPRQENQRPDSDLPRSLRSEVRQSVLEAANAKQGRSNMNSRKKLRDFFEVDRHWVTLAALEALVKEGLLDVQVLVDAIEKFGIDVNKPNPLDC